MDPLVGYHETPFVNTKAKARLTKRDKLHAERMELVQEVLKLIDQAFLVLSRRKLREMTIDVVRAVAHESDKDELTEWVSQLREDLSL